MRIIRWTKSNIKWNINLNEITYQNKLKYSDELRQQENHGFKSILEALEQKQQEIKQKDAKTELILSNVNEKLAL